MAQLKITSRMRSSCPDAEESFCRHYDADGNLIEEKNVTKEVDCFGGYFT
jgi:hypothetical protein